MGNMMMMMMLRPTPAASVATLTHNTLVGVGAI
jgi:hypothetical protein